MDGEDRGGDIEVMGRKKVLVERQGWRQFGP